MTDFHVLPRKPLAHRLDEGFFRGKVACQDFPNSSLFLRVSYFRRCKNFIEKMIAISFNSPCNSRDVNNINTDHLRNLYQFQHIPNRSIKTYEDRTSDDAVTDAQFVNFPNGGNLPRVMIMEAMTGVHSHAKVFAHDC